MTKLISDEQRTQLLANGRLSMTTEGFDPAPVVKLFTPNATWSRVKAAMQGASVFVYLGHGLRVPAHADEVDSERT